MPILHHLSLSELLKTVICTELYTEIQLQAVYLFRQSMLGVTVSPRLDLDLAFIFEDFYHITF